MVGYGIVVFDEDRSVSLTTLQKVFYQCRVSYVRMRVVVLDIMYVARVRGGNYSKPYQREKYLLEYEKSVTK